NVGRGRSGVARYYKPAESNHAWGKSKIHQVSDTSQSGFETWRCFSHSFSHMKGLCRLCSLEFAAQLNGLTVWHDESKLNDVLVSVNRAEPHTLHQSSLRRSDKIEETELDGFAIRQ